MASRLLSDCVPKLASIGEAICEDYNQMFAHEGLTLRPICTLRSTEEQFELFKKGREVELVNGKPVVKSEKPGLIVTKIDGITKFSKHNPTPEFKQSRAIDFGVFKDGKYLTDNKYYKPLLDLARKYGIIRSGWDFNDTGLPLEVLLKKKGFKDPPHIELK